MKILFVLGSRSEWGYILPVIEECKKRNIEYGIFCTNMVLLSKHGGLVNELRNEGYNIVGMTLSAFAGDSHYSMTKMIGSVIHGLTDTLLWFKPTWLVLAGDRAEMLGAAVAGAYTYTRVAHIQAGERSGNIDGAARHAITKLVHLHFTSNLDATSRVRGLGEEEFRIKEVGAPQIDDMVRFAPCRRQLDRILPGTKDYVLAIVHPVTDNQEEGISITRTILKCWESRKERLVWILPNNDSGAELINSELNDGTVTSYVFNNLSRKVYLNVLAHSKAIIGNSSSGILEAPTFKIPCLNIGSRQRGRFRANNVLDVDASYQSIKEGISKILSSDMVALSRAAKNPYGDGKSAQRIINDLMTEQGNVKLFTKEITF